jgi:hypothetical protein
MKAVLLVCAVAGGLVLPPAQAQPGGPGGARPAPGAGAGPPPGGWGRPPPAVAGGQWGAPRYGAWGAADRVWWGAPNHGWWGAPNRGWWGGAPGYWGPRVGVVVGAPVVWGGPWPGVWGGTWGSGWGTWWGPWPAPWGVGAAWPVATAPVVVSTPAPTVIVQQGAPAAAEPAASFWYYCTQPQGYFPYVQSCESAWLRVVPQAPGESTSPPRLAP